jgi:predicted GIY-YIG superfamily endonuclease
MWYVNFLQLGNGDTYVGSTSDLRRRITSQEKGQVASTKALLPVALMSYIAVQTRKKCSRAGKILQVRVRQGICQQTSLVANS